METTHTLILNTTLLFILRKVLMKIFLTIPLQLKTFDKATGYCICQFQQQKPGLPESLFNFVVPSLMDLSSYAKFIRPSIRTFTEQPAQQQTQTPIGPPTYPPILPHPY